MLAARCDGWRKLRFSAGSACYPRASGSTTSSSGTWRTACPRASRSSGASSRGRCSTSASTRSTGRAPPRARPSSTSSARAGTSRSRSSYACLGVGKQVLVDIRPSARVELVNESLAVFERLWDSLEAEADRELRPLGGPIGSLAELEERHRDRLPRPARRARDRPRGRVDRLRLEHGHLRAHPGARPGADLRRVPSAPPAGRGVQLPDRPPGPLRVLRPVALALQLPPLLRPRLAARQLAAPLPEPHPCARLPPARARRGLRARLRDAFGAKRGGAGGAARPAARAAVQQRLHARGAGRDGPLVRRPPRLSDLPPLPIYSEWHAASH